MESLHIKLKLGALEVEYDGPTGFAEQHLMHMIGQFSTLDIPDAVASERAPPTAGAPAPTGLAADSRAKLSTTDFAAKMGAKSGSDLTMAAAASLHHTKGLEEFRRSDLLAEMKGAKAFYRASYGSNLSKSLEMLVKSSRLQSPRPDTYALPYAEIENMRRYI